MRGVAEERDEDRHKDKSPADAEQRRQDPHHDPGPEVPESQSHREVRDARHRVISCRGERELEGGEHDDHGEAELQGPRVDTAYRGTAHDGTGQSPDQDEGEGEPGHRAKHGVRRRPGDSGHRDRNQGSSLRLLLRPVPDENEVGDQHQSAANAEEPPGQARATAHAEVTQ